MTSIFLDTNVVVYAAGAPSRYKDTAAQVLVLAEERPNAIFTNAEVAQELIHRYVALRRWEEGEDIFTSFVTMMQGRIESMLIEDVRAAASLVNRYPRLSSRDLIHVAVMQRVGSERIISADSGFDSMPGITRLDPLKLAEWRSTVPDD